MTTISKDKKTSAEKAVEAKPASDGPHTFRGRKNIKEKSTAGDPAYVVTVKAEEKGQKEKVFYTPDELRAKARAMLGSGKLSPQEKRVLEEILGPQKDDKKI